LDAAISSASRRSAAKVYDRRVGRRVLAAGVVSSALALAVACEVAFPTHLEGTALEAGAPDAPEASLPDAAPDGGCAHAFPPPPPTSDPNPNARIIFTAAVKEIVTRTQTEAGVPLGFDLDDSCTCLPDPPSCVSQKQQCDGPGGRDGAGDVLFSLLDAFFASSTEPTLNDRIQKGRIGFLLWISDYNGEADDPNVFASVLLSTGILDDPDAGSHIKPKWDGNDLWNVDPAFIAGYTKDADGGYHYTPGVLSTEAYVTHNTLVAKIPTVRLSFEVSQFAVSDVVFSGDISTTPYGYRIDGQFSGRMSTREVLSITSTVPDPLHPGQFLCGDDNVYQNFRTQVCSIADISANPANDNQGKPCDALSVTFGVTAFSAMTGAPYGVTIGAPGCDGSVDDCTPP
jgi:hypothetical protein